MLLLFQSVIPHINITQGAATLAPMLGAGCPFRAHNTRTMWYKEPMQRVEIPEYMERSVLEAVVNSLAHRDYLIQGSEVHVDMYDDRMSIYSPGGMPEGRLIQNMDLSAIPSVRRNPVVADILTQLGYMERKGSGMGKILNPIKGLPYFTEKLLPKFFSDRAQFTITFPNMIRVWQAMHPEIEADMIEYADTQDVPQDGVTTPTSTPTSTPHKYKQSPECSVCVRDEQDDRKTDDGVDWIERQEELP